MVVVHVKTYGLWSLVEAFVPIGDSGVNNVDFNFGLLLRYPRLQRVGRISQHCTSIFSLSIVSCLASTLKGPRIPP